MSVSLPRIAVEHLNITLSVKWRTAYSAASERRLSRSEATYRNQAVHVKSPLTWFRYGFAYSTGVRSRTIRP